MAQQGVSNNIYTVLMLITLLVLIGGVGYLAVQNNELFGTWNPLNAPKTIGMLFPGVSGV